MRFEEAYGGWQERRLTQEEAARLAGVCERTFRRYQDRYWQGADLVAEVVGPDHPDRDLVEKRAGYAEAGFRSTGSRTRVARRWRCWRCAGMPTSSTAGTGGERRPSRCCSTASRRRCRRCSTPRRGVGEGVNVDYLHTCRALHAWVIRIRYGRAQNLERIEDAVAGIRSSRQLACDDIERTRDSEVRDADAFGFWPHLHGVHSSGGGRRR